MLHVSDDFGVKIFTCEDFHSKVHFMCWFDFIIIWEKDMGAKKKDLVLITENEN